MGDVAIPTTVKSLSVVFLNWHSYLPTKASSEIVAEAVKTDTTIPSFAILNSSPNTKFVGAVTEKAFGKLILFGVVNVAYSVEALKS